MKKFQICTQGNENISKGIQDKLFELGYGWYGDVKEYEDFHFRWLMPWEDGSICRDFEKMKGDDWPEITISELFTLTKEDVNPKSKVHEYTQAEAFAALRKIHDINEGEIKIKES